MRENNIAKRLDALTIELLLVRFVSLFFGVLTDKTEARYAEIGRKMLETGDYITPLADYGVPFWAKPPLSFWATAGSFKLFGANEFAAHLPHFLFMLGVLVLAYLFAKRHFGTLAASVSALVLATMPMFLYLAGGVMTDPALAFCVMLSLVGFYNGIEGGADARRCGHMFFVGCGLAMLAKGPIGLILIGFPIGLFVIMKGKWRELWKRLPWVGGTLLATAIALPWYILAELKTPGFLEYFIVGEHYKRFVIPDWQGDLYGNAHLRPFGAIWLFYFLLMLPWSAWLALRIKNAGKAIKDDTALYMTLCSLAPAIFFTFSRHTLPTYIAASLAPTAILAAVVACKEAVPRMEKFYGAFALALVLVGATFFMPYIAKRLDKTDKYFVKAYEESRSSPDIPLVYFNMHRFSGEFYTAGKIKIVDDLSGADEIFVITEKDGNAPFGEEILRQKKRVLLRIRK